MAGRLGAFKSDRARDDFLALYDKAVEQLWPLPAVEFDIDTSYGSTHARQSGPASGSPIVLLHPHSGTSISWFRLVEPLAERHQVFALDTVGAMGRSVQTRPVNGPNDYSVWMREVLDKLELGPAHLIGYSEGGYVAMNAAQGNPERLASLVAIDAGGTVERIRLRFLGAMIWAGLRAQVNRDVLREFGQRMSPGVEYADLEWDLMTTGVFAFRHGLPLPKKLADDQLRALTMPTLLYMAADTEVYNPHRASQRAHALMPDVETVIVEGAQHGLPYQFPERTTREILDFIRRHEPPSQSKT